LPIWKTRGKLKFRENLDDGKVSPHICIMEMSQSPNRQSLKPSVASGPGVQPEKPKVPTHYHQLPSSEVWQSRNAVQGTGTPIPPKIISYAPTLFQLLVATLFSAFACFYAYEALVSLNPRLGRLLFAPSTTFLVVSILSQGVTFFMRQLFSNVFDTFRWGFAARSKGVALTSFVALGSATPLSGVFRLLIESGPHRNWCLQRYASPSIDVI
jgi:hypothetical protein